MSSVESIIFDLDGTLWDTCAACATGWNNVLKKNRIGFREIVADDVRGVAGKPHDECIRIVFEGLPEFEIKLLIQETAEEDNRIVAELGGELYPFVKEGLERLQKQYRIFIVSNCQSGYIETFLSYSNLSHLICDFECFGNTLQSKAKNITSLMTKNLVSSAVYVGDTTGDQAAAREAGIPFVFVKYGFGLCRDSNLQFSSFFDLVHYFELKSLRSL